MMHVSYIPNTPNAVVLFAAAARSRKGYALCDMQLWTGRAMQRFHASGLLLQESKV